MINLTKWQQEIINSPATVKIVMGGHCSGKTTLAITNLWEEMKRNQRKSFKSIFLVNRDKILKVALQGFKYIIPPDCLLETIYKDEYNCYIVTTTMGEIYISTCLFDFAFDNITIDNATSNKYVNEKLLDGSNTVFMAGHFPANMDNLYFKIWLREYFSDNPNCRAFRIETWQNPSMDAKTSAYSKARQEAMGKCRYNRDYLGIPDYTGKVSNPNESPSGNLLNLLKNNEIDFKIDPKLYTIIGFDKAKE